MAESSHEHRFNSDLLVGTEDRAEARRAFPVVFHLLDDEDLRTVFTEVNTPANQAKRRSLRHGVVAACLVVAGLCGTAGDRIYEAYGLGSIAMWLTSAFAMLGVVGVGVGLGGVMIWKAKKEWLHNRLTAERLRQFHFQTLLYRIPEVAQSLAGEDAQRRFRDERLQWLARFELRFRDQMGVEFNHVLQNEERSGVWLHPAPAAIDEATLQALPEQFFEAYLVLRIRHQVQYAVWKLRTGQNLLGGFNLRSLEAMLANGSLVFTILLVLTEVLIAVLTWHLPDGGAAAGAANADPSQTATALASAWAHWAAVVFAVVALAMRTLEDGLQPKREIERYRRYELDVTDILDRFTNASTRTAKLEAMIEMERIAYEEMRDFLRSAYESRFIM